VPVSAWGHFYPEETTAEGLAEAMVAFFKRFDWDFLKVHARASYHVEGWGFRYRPSTRRDSAHVCTGHPIDSPAAWRRIRTLPPDSTPLAEQLDALRRIRRSVGDDVPIVMTVFSPLDIAEKLVDRDAGLLQAHIAQDEDAVRSALAAFADTFERFVRDLVAEGVDGIYFSTKWANRRKLGPEAYARLARPFDLQVLAAARPLWCNVLHLCEGDIKLAAMADYPVHVFHWDTRAPGNATVAEGRALLERAVGGGVDAATLATGSAAEVRDRAVAAIRESAGAGFVLGPGCSAAIARTPDANFAALRAASDHAAG
jgi:uroporphyrinogen decarboxylase